LAFQIISRLKSFEGSRHDECQMLPTIRRYLILPYSPYILLGLGSFKTPRSIYQFTRHNIWEDSNIYQLRFRIINYNATDMFCMRCLLLGLSGKVIIT